MAGIFQICLVIGGIGNLLLIDRVGRRILFLSGLITLSVCLGLFAGFSAKFGETGSSSKNTKSVLLVEIPLTFRMQAGEKLASQWL